MKEMRTNLLWSKLFKYAENKYFIYKVKYYDIALTKRKDFYTWWVKITFYILTSKIGSRVFVWLICFIALIEQKRSSIYQIKIV